MTKQIKTTAAQLEAINATKADATAPDAPEAAPAEVAKLDKAQSDRVQALKHCLDAEAAAVEGALKASDDTRRGLLLLAESRPCFDLVWSELSEHPLFAARASGSKAGASVLKSTLKRYFKLAALDIAPPAVDGLKGWDRYSRDELAPLVKEAEGRANAQTGKARGARAGGKAETSAGKATDTSNGETMVGREITAKTFLKARGGVSYGDMMEFIADLKSNEDKKVILLMLGEAEEIFEAIRKMGRD